MYEIIENDEFRLYDRTYDTYAKALDQLIEFEQQLRVTGHATTCVMNGAFRYYDKNADSVGILVQIHRIGE